MSRERELVKNSLILFLGTVVPKMIAVVLLPVITAYLTKAEYGTYDLITILVSLFLPVATLEMQTAVFRFLIEAREQQERKCQIITNVFVFTLAVSVVALTICYAILAKKRIPYALLIVSYFFMDTVLATFRQIARGLSYNKVYSMSAMISSVVELVLTVWLVVFIKIGLQGVLVALFVGQAISAIYIFLRIRIWNYIRWKLVSSCVLKELTAYSWPLVPNALSSWIIRVSDRTVILWYMGIEETAVYGAANKLPNMLSIFQSTFLMAWQENASIHVQDEDSAAYYGAVFQNIYNIMAGAMALLTAATPVLFPLLIKGAYDAAYAQMPILYLGMLFSMLSSYIGGIYIAHKESRSIGITTTIAAIINILINVAFIPVAGLYAASLSTLISYIWLTVYRMIDIQKIQKIHFDYRQILRKTGYLIVMTIFSYQRRWQLDILNVVMALVLNLQWNKKYISTAVSLIKSKIR
jgi:O-antigen/teichoic acid export membrane protein